MAHEYFGAPAARQKPVPSERVARMMRGGRTMAERSRRALLMPPPALPPRVQSRARTLAGCVSAGRNSPGGHSGERQT